MGTGKKAFAQSTVQGAYQRPEALLIYSKEDPTSGTATMIVITADYVCVT